MKKIEITSPQIYGKAYLGIREITGWWSSKNSSDLQYKITEARLEQTVYFVIKTNGVRDGTKLELQLYNLEEFLFLDYLCPDKYKFNGKTETAITYIQNNSAIIELELPITWTLDVKDDRGKMELYWRIRANGLNETSLPKCKSDYLSVRYSNQNLYVKSSPINDDFPEFYDSDGSLLIVAMSSEVIWNESDFSQIKNSDDEDSYIGLSEISTILDDKILRPIIKTEIQRLTLVKLSSGYMVDNNGHIYTNITSNGTERKVYFKEIYTTDGMIAGSFQGKNFTLPNGTTTVGIDQYQFFSKHGMKAKTLGYLKQVGKIWDIFSFVDILNMGLDGEKKELPIPAPGAGVLGMITQVKIQEFEEFYEQYQNKNIDEELNEIKKKGLDAVERWVSKNRDRYFIVEISKTTALNILLGKFETYQELLNFDEYENPDSERDIVILMKISIDKILEKEIYIIESFFKK